jgi:folylpolyglutamate synthase
MISGILNSNFGKSEVRRKIGFFSSPHLIEVRERIRIDGVPISREMFTKYFFEVWEMLEATSCKDGSKRNKIAENVDETCAWDKPGYFRYLTLMALHVFKQEKVDVLILEVGVGGRYDATNIVEQPMVTAITSLGI